MPLIHAEVAAGPAPCQRARLASDAAYAEHGAAGYVFTDDQTVTGLAMRFDTLRAESRKASESLGLIERMEQTWARGARAATAGQPAASA